MDDAVRNLEPITMDDSTRDSYSSALLPALVPAGIVLGGAVIAGIIYNAYKRWTTRNQQPENPTVQDQSVREPLLQGQPSTGGRRLTRHRKNRNRKTRAKRRT
jgi:hypothetical protein